jgi:thymidine phosphorylase
MLLAGGLAKDHASGQARLERALESGAAAEHFARMVAELGGPRDFLARPGAYLAQAPVVVPAKAEVKGFVTAIDVRAIGLAVVALGGGRRRASDTIDPAVGFSGLAGLGTHVTRGDPLGFVHASDAGQAEVAAKALQAACTIGPVAPVMHPVIIEMLDAESAG